MDPMVYNLLGFWNFDFWPYGHLAQISAILIFSQLQKLYVHKLLLVSFTKWFNPPVNLSNLNEVSEELRKIVPNLLTDYSLLIPQALLQNHYQILSIIFLKDFIELNVSTDMNIKNVKHVELNISIVAVFLNTQILKII